MSEPERARIRVNPDAYPDALSNFDKFCRILANFPGLIGAKKVVLEIPALRGIFYKPLRRL